MIIKKHQPKLLYVLQMASSQQSCLSDLKNSIPLLLQNTTKAYATLGAGILALDKFQRAAELLDNVICSLKEEHEKYDDLLRVIGIIITVFPLYFTNFRVYIIFILLLFSVK